MVRKRKCSNVSSTPQTGGLKKVKIDKSDNNNNSTRRRSTRTVTKNVKVDNEIQDEDEIIQTEDENTQTEVKSEEIKQTIAVQKGKGKIKPKKSAKVNSKNVISKSVSNKNENVDVDQSADELVDNSDQHLNAQNKNSVVNGNNLNLSDGESENDTKKKSQVNGHSKVVKSKNVTKEKNKKSQGKKSRPNDEDMKVDQQSDNESIKSSDDVRRSARKRKSRFSFKELVSSGDEDDESVDEKTISNRRKKISKKEMARKVKEFMGSSDEDEYKPDAASEHSDDEEIVDADEEISDNDAGNSDIFDVRANTSKRSKYFNKTNKKTVGKKQSQKKTESYKPEKTASSLDLSKYKAPKSGGCTHNSIGINSLGNPQADLLKHKIANFKVPDNLAQTVSQACKSSKSKTEIVDAESAFGNGSCVRKLLMESQIAKSYEKYKKVHIEKTKNAEKISKEEMMNILNTFESDITNSHEQKSNSDAQNLNSDEDTDDDDFEEVEDADVGEDFDNYRPECLKKGVTIEVQPSFKQRNKNKNDDWIYDAIRQGINRQRREIYMNATKVHVLCNLARLRYLNGLTFDAEMQALASSIDFFENLKTESITDSFVRRFIDKFKATFKFNYSKDRSRLITSREAIEEFFETKETYHPTIYNLIFLILFRTFCQQNAIEANSRLCIAFRPIDFKCDNLLSKKKDSTKKTKVEEDCFSEDEKPKKTKGKTKKDSNAKSTKKVSKKKADESDDEESEKLEEKDKIVDKEEEMSLNKKNLIEIWIEIYLHEKKEWILKKKSGKQSEKILKSTNGWCSIELINSIYTSTPEQFEKKFHANPLYILSFDSKHHLKDLTPKYITNFYLHKFKRLRVEDDWLNETYSAFRPIEPSLEDVEEDEQIKRSHLDKALPRSLSDYKNHGLYFLERHLLKYEIIWPDDAPVVGKFNEKEKVYLRENVHETHGREYWKKEGRQVKKGEQAVKVTTARPKWDKNLGDWVRDLPLELYHYSQTIPWQPGEVKDGKVPRNEFGNVDLFKPEMLPHGASYLRLNGLLKIAQKLNIDCVPAVTGFDLKKHMTVPLVDGFVVPSEYEEILTIAWKEEQELQYQKEIEKYYKRVYGNWRRLIKGVLIHIDIKRKYAGD